MKTLAFLDETSSAVVPTVAERNLLPGTAVADEVEVEKDRRGEVEAERDRQGEAEAEIEKGPEGKSQERKRNARGAEGVDQEKEKEADLVKEREPEEAEVAIASEIGKASEMKGRIKTLARTGSQLLRKRMSTSTQGTEGTTLRTRMGARKRRELKMRSTKGEGLRWKILILLIDFSLSMIYPISVHCERSVYFAGSCHYWSPHVVKHVFLKRDNVLLDTDVNKCYAFV